MTNLELLLCLCGRFIFSIIRILAHSDFDATAPVGGERMPAIVFWDLGAAGDGNYSAQPLTPLRTKPWMKYRCARKKTIIGGASAIPEAAIIRAKSERYSEMNAEMPTEMGYLV